MTLPPHPLSMNTPCTLELKPTSPLLEAIIASRASLGDRLNAAAGSANFDQSPLDL